jgi:hypothetical protein
MIAKRQSASGQAKQKTIRSIVANPIACAALD